jgi:hypothetical protein
VMKFKKFFNEMKKRFKILFTVFIMLMFSSCGDNETHVINTVHEDGSVNRKVTVKTTDKKDFIQKNSRVPVDSTWRIEITYDINENKDTVWLLTADKHFDSVEEINEEYDKDKGSNRALKRSADFTKSFKWFTTVFRYTETIEKVLTIDCPMSDFLTGEELKFAYLPGKIRGDLKNGPDSVRIKEMEERIDRKSEEWLWTCEFRQWVEVFYDLFGDNPDLGITRDEMRSRESEFAQLMTGDDNNNDEGANLDSLFATVVGEDFVKTFKTEIDSAGSVVDTIDSPFWGASKYDMEIRMPGRIIASNGYAEIDPDSDNGGGILWTVKGDYFLTETYEMWAESKVNNYFIWIITGLFILFVSSGLIFYHRKAKSS